MMLASAMDSPSCGMMMGMEGIGNFDLQFAIYDFHNHWRNRFLAAAAMLRAVGRCAVHKFG